MPNKDSIEKWIEALRSGEYRQGKGYLNRYKNGESLFCCLGVACEVAMKNGVVVDTKKEMGGGEIEAVVWYDGTSTTLPLSVQNWLGLGNSNPYVLDQRGDWWYEGVRSGNVDTMEGYSSLSFINDVGGADFDAISDMIERQFLDG